MHNIEDIPELLMLEMLASIQGIGKAQTLDEKLKHSELFLNLSKSMSHIANVMGIDEEAMNSDLNETEDND